MIKTKNERMENGSKRAFDTVIHRCIDFVLILKGEILRECQNIEKFVMFWKKHDFKKIWIAMFPTLASIETRRERPAFPLAFKETGSAPDIY